MISAGALLGGSPALHPGVYGRAGFHILGTGTLSGAPARPTQVRRLPCPEGWCRKAVPVWSYVRDLRFIGLHAIVVPGTLRDSLMILDGLLELAAPGDGGPTVIITDQAPTPIRSSVCSGCWATSSAPAPPACPTNGSGASTATPTTARSTASPATASTPS